MLCFRRMKTLQKFVAVLALVHNHLKQKNRSYSRNNFKRNRAVALFEWRHICLA